jgi:signal transduction histidine kinase
LNPCRGNCHDFKNILAPIIGCAEMVLDDVPDKSPLHYDLNQILSAANRAKDLVKQILSFSRLGEEQLMRPLDLVSLRKKL